jgi:hypothetical protein
MHHVVWRSRAIGVLLAALPICAHHSTALYDLVHGTIIGGVVTEFAWKNPHTYILIDVSGENNELEHWSVELESGKTRRPDLSDRRSRQGQQLPPSRALGPIAGRPQNARPASPGELTLALPSTTVWIRGNRIATPLGGSASAGADPSTSQPEARVPRSWYATSPRLL